MAQRQAGLAFVADRQVGTLVPGDRHVPVPAQGQRVVRQHNAVGGGGHHVQALARQQRCPRQGRDHLQDIAVALLVQAMHGLDEQRYRDILQVVSPLARAPLLPRERLHVVAAAADRIVLPHHPLALGRHWDVPVTWYQGSHLSIRYEREPGLALRHAAAAAGWPVS